MVVNLTQTFGLPNLSDKIVLDKPPESFDLTLGLSPLGVDEIYFQGRSVKLVIRLTESHFGLVLRTLVLEHGFGQAPALQRLIPDSEDIQLSLILKPPSGGAEPTVIIQGGNQIQGPNFREVNLAHNIRLPKIVGVFRFKSLDGFNSFQVLPNETRPLKNPTDGTFVNLKFQFVTNVSSRPPAIPFLKINN